VLRGCSEPHQVTEEHRDDLAFLADRRRGGLAEWSRTKGAERKVAGELLAAVRACGHDPSFAETGRSRVAGGRHDNARSHGGRPAGNPRTRGRASLNALPFVGVTQRRCCSESRGLSPSAALRGLVLETDQVVQVGVPAMAPVHHVVPVGPCRRSIAPRALPVHIAMITARSCMAARSTSASARDIAAPVKLQPFPAITLQSVALPADVRTTAGCAAPAVSSRGRWPRRCVRGSDPRGRCGASTPRSCG
jgi:hypothetical protein